MELLAPLNGQFLPQSRGTLALNDAGFVFGATVTDLCRTFAHRPYRLADHLARFAVSCDPPSSPSRSPTREMTAWADGLLAHNAALAAEQDGPGPVRHAGTDRLLPGGSRAASASAADLRHAHLPAALRPLSRPGRARGQLVIPYGPACPRQSVDRASSSGVGCTGGWPRSKRERSPGRGGILLDDAAMSPRRRPPTSSSFAPVQSSRRRADHPGRHQPRRRDRATLHTSWHPVRARAAHSRRLRDGGGSHAHQHALRSGRQARIDDTVLPCPGPLTRCLSPAWNGDGDSTCIGRFGAVECAARPLGRYAARPCRSWKR